MGPYTALPLVSRDPIKGQYNLPYSLLPAHQSSPTYLHKLGGWWLIKAMTKKILQLLSMSIEFSPNVMKNSN